jgi:hypothetical protein
MTLRGTVYIGLHEHKSLLTYLIIRYVTVRIEATHCLQLLCPIKDR